MNAFNPGAINPKTGVVLPAGARVIEFKDDETLTYVVKHADKAGPNAFYGLFSLMP